MFPFFKLPLELRQAIYKLLLWPLYSTEHDDYYAADDSFLLEVRVDRGSLRRRLKPPLHAPQKLAHLSKEAYDALRAKYIARCARQTTSHPFRFSAAELEANVSCTDVDGPWNADLFHYDWLPQLSNVSTVFRYELGCVMVSFHIHFIDVEADLYSGDEVRLA